MQPELNIPGSSNLLLEVRGGLPQFGERGTAASCRVELAILQMVGIPATTLGMASVLSSANGTSPKDTMKIYFTYIIVRQEGTVKPLALYGYVFLAKNIP